MDEEVKKELEIVLNKVWTCASNEWEGSSEHITEYVSPNRIKNLAEKLGIEVKRVSIFD